MNFPVFPPNPYVERKAREFSPVHTLDEAVILAESLGITVDFGVFAPDFQGVLVQGKESDTPRMCVNRTLRECEQAQVILHEIGHYLLHDDNCLSFSRLGAEHDHRREEREADYFAYLLMSERLWEDYCTPPDDGGWAE